MNKYLTLFLILLFVSVVITATVIWQGLNSFLFAWILNFMLMMGILYITETFNLKLSSSYFNSQKWEAKGTIYKWFGIHLFRKLLVLVGWEKLNKAANPVKKNLGALQHLEYATRQSEFGHLIIFVIVLVLTFFVGIRYGFEHTLWLNVLNLLLNVYPMGVQRYNRPRLRTLIKRSQNHTALV